MFPRARANTPLKTSDRAYQPHTSVARVVRYRDSSYRDVNIQGKNQRGRERSLAGSELFVAQDELPSTPIGRPRRLDSGLFRQPLPYIFSNPMMSTVDDECRPWPRNMEQGDPSGSAVHAQWRSSPFGVASAPPRAGLVGIVAFHCSWHDLLSPL